MGFEIGAKIIYGVPVNHLNKYETLFIVELSHPIAVLLLRPVINSSFININNSFSFLY